MNRSPTAIWRCWTSFVWRLEARFKGVQFEGRCCFVGRPMISVARDARIVLGDGVCLASSRANPLGYPYRCTLRALAPGSRLSLGSGVRLKGSALCAGTLIEVGEGAMFEPGALVIDNDFHQPIGEWDWVADFTTNARPVRIGRGALIGPGAIILKGVTIGDRAVVESGSVVTQDVPRGHRAAGNPARALPADPA